MLFELISDFWFCLVFVFFFLFSESILSGGNGLATALPLSYLEINFFGQKGKKTKLHLTSRDKVKGSIIIFLFLV